MRIYKFCIQPGLQPKIQVRRYVIMLFAHIFSQLSLHVGHGLAIQILASFVLNDDKYLTVLMFFLGEEQNIKLIK